MQDYLNHSGSSFNHVECLKIIFYTRLREKYDVLNFKNTGELCNKQIKIIHR